IHFEASSRRVEPQSGSRPSQGQGRLASSRWATGHRRRSAVAPSRGQAGKAGEVALPSARERGTTRTGSSGGGTTPGDGGRTVSRASPGRLAEPGRRAGRGGRSRGGFADHPGQPEADRRTGAAKASCSVPTRRGQGGSRQG